MRKEALRPGRDRRGAGVGRDHGRDGAAQHRDAGAGVGHVAVDRHPVRGRAAAGRGDGAVPDGADLFSLARPRRQHGRVFVARDRAGRLQRHSGAGGAGDPDRRHRQRHRHAHRGLVDGRDLRAGAVDRVLSLLAGEAALAGDGEHGRAGRHGALHHQHRKHALVVTDAGQDAAADRRAFNVLHGSAWLFMLATIVTLVLMGALLEGPASAADLRPVAAADGRAFRHRHRSNTAS